MEENEKSKFICTLCPRNCGAERDILSGNGFCGMGLLPRVSRAAPHFWEEPCISGEKGSGTVFFTGCSLQCVYCQNRKISLGEIPDAPVCDARKLREIYFSLIKQGVHNINLVTPTHFTNIIADSLAEPLPVPVVWNTGGYEKIETLKTLKGKVQIYLADMKYGSSDCGNRYSHAPDYPETAKNAILEMFSQVGKYQLDENGMMKSGVIIRHLVLPGELDNTFDVLDWVHDTFKKGDVLFSLMAQYTPQEGLDCFPNLRRRVTEEEYHRAEEYMLTLGIDEGFTQEPGSAVSDYTPDFDRTVLP